MLADAGCEIHQEGRSIKCAFHGEQHASAGVYEEGGVWRFKCHGCQFGGDYFDVLARVTGKTVKEAVTDYVKQNGTRDTKKPTQKHDELQPERAYPSLEKLGEAVAWSAQGAKVLPPFVYVNPDSKNADLIVYRIEYSDGTKQFRQAHQRHDGFVMKAPAGPLPLYNRTRVRGASVIIVVEGEKCVHRLQNLGYIATTSPGGAGKARLADWAMLAGKLVYLWPDCDAANQKTGKRAGIEHMRDVADILDKLNPAPTVKWIDCDQLNLPPKGDVVDYLSSAGSTSADEQRLAIDAVLEFAETLGAAKELKAELEAGIAGKRTPLPFPWFALSGATRALIPGMITVLCGPPGHGKSFLLLEALAWWHTRGERVAVLELESERTEHLFRAVAQRSGVAKFAEAEWQEKHPEEARKIFSEHEEFVNSFGRCIHVAPVGTLSVEMVLGWMNERAIAGCRVIVVDPITAIEVGEKSWVADHRVIIAAHQLAVQYSLSVVLVTHPRKSTRPRVTNDLDDIAGGSAYQRFSQTILWLEHQKKEKQGSFSVSMGRTDATYDRLLHILKARHSWGTWKAVGLFFNKENFRYHECGIYIPDGE